MGDRIVREKARRRRHKRVRIRISGTDTRPRLNVFRSARHIFAQVIDDVTGRTLAAASTIDPKLRDEIKGLKKVEQAAAVGRILAQRAREKGIEAVVFDTSGYRYHGRVKALADGAREGGLQF